MTQRRMKSKTLVIFTLLVLVVLVPVILWKSRTAPPDGPARTSQETRLPAQNASVPPAQQDADEDDSPGVPSLDIDSVVREATASDTSPKKAKKMAYRAVQSFVVQIQNYWELEDAVMREVPGYEEVRSEYETRARVLLATIDLSDPNEILALIDREREAFWSSGSLSQRESYPHAYLAWAMAEIAVQEHPEDFRIACALADVVSSVIPVKLADGGRNPDVTVFLRPVMDRAKDLVVSGSTPLSDKAMVAMYDWQMLAQREGDMESAEEGMLWLVDHCDEAGWAPFKPKFQSILDNVRAGQTHGMNLQVLSSRAGIESDDEWVKLWGATGRQLELCSRSLTWRERVTKLWEHPEYLPGAE